jgi:L-seryl-tRNA(Ser) seleniumtransferase
VIVGRAECIERIKRNPLKRALRCDKLTIGALSATLRLYLRSGDIGTTLPTLRILGRSVSEIAAMAPRAREILVERLGAGYRVEIVEATSQVGSGALPVKELATLALRVTHPEKSANAIASMFRRARIIGRVVDDSFQLDLRTVEDPALFAVKLASD